jgi:hypothetical protein
MPGRRDVRHGLQPLDVFLGAVELVQADHHAERPAAVAVVLLDIELAEQRTVEDVGRVVLQILAERGLVDVEEVDDDLVRGDVGADVL